MTSLKHKTVSGVKWQAINKAAQKVISVVAFAVLARILEPSTFGLFALAFVAIDGFQILKSFGIDSALIQWKENLDEAAHTAFIIVQGTGLIFFAVCYAIAPLASYFFHSPDVLPIIRALGIVFVFSSFAKIPSTLLTKQMRFDVIAKVELTGAIVNAVLAVAFALLSPTVWSLVLAYIFKQITIALMTRYYSGYRFKWRFDPVVAKKLLGFGKYIIGLGVLWYVGDNLNNIVVAKILGTTLLGYFALAANIGNFFNTHFTYLLENVMFPAYASIQHDKSEVKRIYLKTTRFVSILSIPFSVALMFLSREVVLTLYGEKWLEIVPLMQLFGVQQLVVPILACSGSLFLGCGKPEYSYRLTIWGMIARLPVLILFTKYFGLVGTVSCSFITMFIFVPINLGFVRKIVRFEWREFLPQFLPSLYCAGAMLACIVAVKSFLLHGWLPAAGMGRNLFLLTSVSAAGISAYLATFFLIDRVGALEIFRLIFKIRQPGVSK